MKCKMQERASTKTMDQQNKCELENRTFEIVQSEENNNNKKNEKE